jgi:hypothetical protein
MTGLLSIPCSNADAERGFSMLRKVHTDNRASLKQQTIINPFTGNSAICMAEYEHRCLKKNHKTSIV